MGVRLLLPLLVDAAPLVLDDAAPFFQAAVRADRERADAAAAVIGSQDALAAGIDRHVARPAAAGRLLVDQLQLAGRWIDRQSTDRSRLLSLEVGNLPDGIDVLAAGMNRQKRRADQLGGELRIGKLAARQVQRRKIN